MMYLLSFLVSNCPSNLYLLEPINKRTGLFNWHSLLQLRHRSLSFLLIFPRAGSLIPAYFTTFLLSFLLIFPRAGSLIPAYFTTFLLSFLPLRGIPTPVHRPYYGTCAERSSCTREQGFCTTSPPDDLWQYTFEYREWFWPIEANTTASSIC